MIDPADTATFESRRTLAAGTSTRIIDGDGDRLVLIFTGVSSLTFFTQSPPAVNTFGLSAVGIGTNVPIVFTAAEHGSLCTGGWFGFAAAGSTITVMGTRRTSLQAGLIGVTDNERQNGTQPSVSRGGDGIDRIDWPESVSSGLDYFGRDEQSLFAGLWNRRDSR